MRGVSVLVVPLITILFFNDPATTEIYTLSLHELFRSQPVSSQAIAALGNGQEGAGAPQAQGVIRQTSVNKVVTGDRKSTRLNSSHSQISYAVFCLKKKKYKQK